MHNLAWKRTAAGVAALALGAGVFAAVPATAAEKDLTVLTFTDFHGRITNLDFVATLDQEHAKAADSTAVLSVGDNVGATLFESSILEDKPTLDMLNALEIDASAVGNHEFDKGWADLRDRIVPASSFPYTTANITGTAPELKPYVLMEKNGVSIAYIGATTSELPGLVSPAGIEGLAVTDPVAAVNAVADQLTDGDAANGEADVLIAGYHEGHSDAITNGTSDKIDVILYGHSHEVYAQTSADGSRAMVQAGNYGSDIGRVDFSYDEATDAVTVKSAENVKPVKGLADTYSSARFDAAKQISERAVAEAEVEGAAEIATAAGDFSRGGMGLATPAEDRGDESTMSNLVANMFADHLTEVTGQPVIGVQNPGGTRADLAAGTITFREAADILPFANTLKTTQVTGAQFRTMLEQQWQRTATGEVPSRPFLALSLSDNVSWTFDESLPEGQRVTSVTIDGRPLDPEATYTVGSGNFLIEGGDNFHVLAEGQNTTDTGWTDLDAWTSWLKTQQTITPSYAKNGVEVSGPSAIAQGTATTFTIGGSSATAPVANGTLDMTSVGFVQNSRVTATIADTEVGSATVTDGRAELAVTVPCTVEGSTLTLTAPDSGTIVTLPVQLTACQDQGAADGDAANSGAGAGTGADAGAAGPAEATDAAARADRSLAGNLARTGGPAVAIVLGGLAAATGGIALVRRFR